VFDYIERFYNPKRRRSTLGNLSPMELCALHAEILIVAQPL
jgi:transposase InsO family protein